MLLYKQKNREVLYLLHYFKLVLVPVSVDCSKNAVYNKFCENGEFQDVHLNNGIGKQKLNKICYKTYYIFFYSYRLRRPKALTVTFEAISLIINSSFYWSRTTITCLLPVTP